MLPTQVPTSGGRSTGGATTGGSAGASAPPHAAVSSSARAAAARRPARWRTGEPPGARPSPVLVRVEPAAIEVMAQFLPGPEIGPTRAAGQPRDRLSAPPLPLAYTRTARFPSPHGVANGRGEQPMEREAVERGSAEEVERLLE